jgi:hypothetical protein
VCLQHCTSEASPFLVDSVYVFDYAVDTRVTAVDADKAAESSVAAKVTISPKDACNFELAVTSLLCESKPAFCPPTCLFP